GTESRATGTKDYRSDAGFVTVQSHLPNHGKGENHMKRIVVFSLIVTMLCSLTIGNTRSLAQSPVQGISTAKPEEVGMSAERLGRIRVAMQRYVDRGMVPGV